MATNGSKDTAPSPNYAPENQTPPEPLISLKEGGLKPIDHTEATRTLNVSSTARDLTSRLLDFLSNASNETLGACVVALGATTWLILGRVGLVMIGLVGGVVLHATWDGSGQIGMNDEARVSEVRKRREKGLDVAARVLDWRERTRAEKESKTFTESSQMRLDFSDFQPETRAALTDLTDAVVRDYVKWWYSPVVPSENKFPFACRQVLTGFLLSVSSHLSRKRPADTFLDFLTNASSIVIVFLSELSSALRAPEATSDASKSVHLFLEANPSSSLANVLDGEQQNRKLTAVADDILQNFLEPKVYACEVTRVFLREILAGVVLDMTVTSCSRSEFINEWIIWSLEESDTGLLEAIDAGVDGARANGNMETPRQAVDVATPRKSDSTSDTITGTQATTEHMQTVSRAEDAMEEAMQEAKRLSELIAEEEAKKRDVLTESSSSGNNTAAMVTPTSSRDDLSATINGSPPRATPTFLRDDNDSITDSTSAPFATGPEALIRSESKIEDSNPSFTTFDQIISSQKPTALQSLQSQPYTVPPLNLYNASVSIFDDSQPGEKGTIRSKPTVEYLLQVEPAASQHPGWMIARKYSDFETLHEVLRRISVVSGVTAFAQKHQTVPGWKGKTKAALRSELELYLRDALSFQRLAESEGMKRFLEKDQGLGRSSPGINKGGFGFPSPAAFETMGKGMLDVLASAPKGAAGGGKAILGGVTGVLGGVGSLGHKKQVAGSSIGRSGNTSEPTSTLPRIDSNGPVRSSFAVERGSQESHRPSINTARKEVKPPLPRRHSQTPSYHFSEISPDTNGFVSSIVPENSPPAHPPLETVNELHLPPPPSEIPDDYNIVQDSPGYSTSIEDRGTLRTPISAVPTTQPSQSRRSTSSLRPADIETAPSSKQTKRGAPLPLSSQETSVAVELFFATINELYTLSSAWTLRLTLLNAAKSFLLRPGNPNLEAIRVLLQTTIIDANTSDTGIATHLTKLRENALPTEAESKAWPPPPSDDAKERMRQKARKLLVEKGMPHALTSVMGAAASGEALGRVFDCLQVPEVARGLVFALILQGVRAVTQ
ncbi:hypothetical protein N7G274_007583 [Stereocaulon virgatum]|uniref:PXA domain-containing protein n=1 Tax=Stereocaulon virgatum TaxID=373712 RepID=A0ABR4A4Q9_9LECA